VCWFDYLSTSPPRIRGHRITRTARGAVYSSHGSFRAPARRRTASLRSRTPRSERRVLRSSGRFSFQHGWSWKRHLTRRNVHRDGHSLSFRRGHRRASDASAQSSQDGASRNGSLDQRLRDGRSVRPPRRGPHTRDRRVHARLAPTEDPAPPPPTKEPRLIAKHQRGYGSRLCKPLPPFCSRSFSWSSALELVTAVPWRWRPTTVALSIASAHQGSYVPLADAARRAERLPTAWAEHASSTRRCTRFASIRNRSFVKSRATARHPWPVLRIIDAETSVTWTPTATSSVLRAASALAT